jgi:hypothetical protein
MFLWFSSAQTLANPSGFPSAHSFQGYGTGKGCLAYGKGAFQIGKPKPGNCFALFNKNWTGQALREWKGQF